MLAFNGKGKVGSGGGMPVQATLNKW